MSRKNPTWIHTTGNGAGVIFLFAGKFHGCSMWPQYSGKCTEDNGKTGNQYALVSVLWGAV